MTDDLTPPALPAEGRCYSCGYLSKRVTATYANDERAHSGFFETQWTLRNSPPLERFNIIPGEVNAVMTGEFGCFRHVNLAQEFAEARVAKLSAQDVIWKDRHCNRWCLYEPGMSPRDHLDERKAQELEDQRQAFQLQLQRFESRQAQRERNADRRLTKAAIWLASIIGFAQLLVALLTMTRDSVAYRWLSNWCH
jgi:hypothetical protein